MRTLEDEQLGGFGLDDLDQRDTVGYKGTAVVQVGRHAVHGGVEFMRNANFRDTTYDGGLYVSLSPALSGLTAGGLIAGSVTNTQFDPTNSSDYTGFIRAIDGLANRAEFYALYDGNRDGTITQDELGASLAFDSTAGRNLPLRVATGEEFEFAGVTRRWLAPAAVGTLGNPAFGIVDIRLLYNSHFARSRLELFADIFNLFDNQDATRNQDLLAGAGGIDFGDGIRFTSPRRVFLGLRLNL